MSCERVIDSAECAVRLAQGKADFGVFNAEEMLLTYQFYPDEFQPIAELRYKDRINGDFLPQPLVYTKKKSSVHFTKLFCKF